MNGGNLYNLSGTDSLTGDSIVQSAFGELLTEQIVSNSNQDPNAIINLEWFNSHGSGPSQNLPIDLAQYQATRPLQSDLDFTNTPQYTMLVTDYDPVLNSKKVVSGNQLFNEINNRMLADQQLSQVISTETTNRTNADDLLRQRTLQDIQDDHPVSVLDLKQGSQIKTSYVSSVDGTIDLNLDLDRAYFTNKCYYLGGVYPNESDTTMLPPKLYVDTEITNAIQSLDPTYTPVSNIVGGLGGRPVFLLQTDTNSNTVTQLDGVQDGSVLGNVTSFRQFQEANTTQSEATALVQTNLDEETKNREDGDTLLQQGIDAIVTDLEDYSTTVENDLRYYLNTVPIQSLTKATGTLDLNNNKISNVLNAVDPQDVTSLQQVQSLIQASSTGLPNNSSLSYISGLNPSTQSITASNQKIISVANGSVSGDVITYDQLQVTNTNLTNESSTRLTNDNTLQTNINTVTSSLQTEVTNRTTGDTNLQTQITTLQGQKNKIESVDTNSSLTCSSGNVIDIKANGNILGKFYQPTGQATTPLGLLSNDKIQLSSGMNAITCFGTNTTPVNTVVYNALRVQNTDVSSTNCYSGLEISTSGGSLTNTSNMSFASGHVNLLNDGVQRAFMSIADQNNSANALSISVGNPFLSPSGTSYTQYLSSLATALSLPQHSFQGSVGYNQTTTIALPNQFPSKKYVDDLLTLYYTKIASDARFVLQTTPLQSITKATASVDVNNNRIVNCLDPVSHQDVATKAYVLANGGGLPSNSTLNSISSTNLTSGSVNLNNQKIVNLSTPTLSTDASTKGYVDSVITPQQQRFVYTNTSITNGSYADIVHGLGSDIDELVFQVYVKYKSSNNGYTTDQWIHLGTIDRSQTLAAQMNLQIMSHTSDVSNQCRVYFCNDGISAISYTGGNFINSNWSAMSVKIVVIKNDGFLVLSSQYATSNLVVNSDIDLLNSSYRIKNSPDAIASGDLVPLSQLTTQLTSYATTSALTTGLNTRYAVTTKLNEITAPNASVNMVGQKVTGLALATANTDAVSLIQLNNKTYSQITALDGTSQISATSFLIQSSSAERHVANDNRIASSSYLFNSTSNSSPNTTTISACMTVNDQLSQVNDNQSRWALQVLATVDNISPQIGTNYQALLCSGLALFSQRIGAGQTTATELVKIEGKCLASQFLVWTPSRLAFKKDIIDYNNQGVLDLIPKKYRYDPQSSYVQQNNIDTLSDNYGFIYEDVVSSCSDHPEFFRDEHSLNMTEIKDSILYSLMTENRSLKTRLSSLEQTVQMLVDRIPQ